MVSRTKGEQGSAIMEGRWVAPLNSQIAWLTLSLRHLRRESAASSAEGVIQWEVVALAALVTTLPATRVHGGVRRIRTMAVGGSECPIAPEKNNLAKK